MGAYRVGHGELVPPVGRLRPAAPGHGSGADRASRRAYAGAPTLSHGWVEGLYGGAASGHRGRVSSSASWESGPQAKAPAGGSAAPLLRPSGQGSQHGWPPCGGQQACRLWWSTPFWQAVAPAPARRDDPDGFHGTLVWHLAGAGRTPATPHPVSVLEPRSPPGEGLAHGQPLQFCDAAQEPAPRAHAAHPSDGHRADRPCVELGGICLAASTYSSRPHPADGQTDCTSTHPSSPGPSSWKDTSTYAYRDASRERTSSSPSTESCVRDPLLFSRTTKTLL